jgi:head-tail adaptor
MAKALESGALRHRVQFWSVNTSQNEGGQMIESPELIFDEVPAAVRNIGGDEEQRGVQMVAGATHLITTRFFNELETRPDMFILMPRYPPSAGATRRLNILRTVDPDFTRRQLLHYCKEEIAANG